MLLLLGLLTQKFEFHRPAENYMTCKVVNCEKQTSPRFLKLSGSCVKQMQASFLTVFMWECMCSLFLYSERWTHIDSSSLDLQIDDQQQKNPSSQGSGHQQDVSFPKILTKQSNHSKLNIRTEHKGRRYLNFAHHFSRMCNFYNGLAKKYVHRQISKTQVQFMRFINQVAKQKACCVINK